jgi:hypothetical protein
LGITLQVQDIQTGQAARQAAGDCFLHHCCVQRHTALLCTVCIELGLPGVDSGIFSQHIRVVILERLEIRRLAAHLDWSTIC